MSSPFRSIATILAMAALLASAPLGAQTRTTVTYAPAVAARMAEFGEAERRTLESAVDTALTRATLRVPLPAGATVRVTFDELEPSHPTRAQLTVNPELDPIRSRSLGGAALSGEVRDSTGRVLATAKHRYFPPTLKDASASLDPWADARRAITQFATQLAAAYRDRTR